MKRGTLQSELHQTRPFHSLGQEATLGLFRTVDDLRRRYGQVLDGVGLTLQQYNVLRILRGAGEAGLPTLAIVERMIEQAPGITRLIDRLENKGWVERCRETRDRRQVLCRITAAGRELMERIDPRIDDLDEACVAVLSREEQETLIALLERVRQQDSEP